MRTYVINGFEFSGVLPNELARLKQLVSTCNGRKEINALCLAWNNSCESVENFTPTVKGRVLANLAQDIIGRVAR